MPDFVEPTQSNLLQDLINWKEIMPLDRYAGGHDEQMQKLFIGAKVLGHWNEGDYQGVVATAVELPDGRFVCYNDYYGSCPGCDAWEDANDDEVKTLCKNLSNDAYIFNTLEDMINWLENSSSYDYDNNWKRSLRYEMRKQNV